MGFETFHLPSRKRRNRVPHSTPEVIDLDSYHFSGKRPISDIIDLSDEDDDDEVKILNFIPKTTPLVKSKRNNNTEKGESSNSKNTPFVCEICTDTKTMRDAFYISGCSHAYCSDCVAMYIGSKLDDNITNIGCPVPGCSGLLEAEFCRSILTPDVFERWGKALCEALFDVTEKFYCPFADCSALLINDRMEAVKNSECPNCNRMFCAQCRVPWHDGIKCSEFEKLNADERGREDVMFMNLAKDMQWRRCPRCRIFVAKSMGCNVMSCRCRCVFCYACGGEYSFGRCNCYKMSLSNIYSNQRQEQIQSRVFRGGVFPGSTTRNHSNRRFYRWNKHSRE
ncbi:RBR-type E3 ubiquitin transferase [Trifolium repens]|nr:RBR-type E3 ubiquitin transferase [Trifolium repens]